MQGHRIVIAGSVITAILVAAIVIARSFVFEFLIIDGSSMNPTIRDGDRVLVDKLAYRVQEPSRGDIITFRMGLKRIVKRIAGVPGDVVEVRNGIFYCNGEAITRKSYVVMYMYPRSLRRRSYSPVIVRDRHVFVVGDNADLSMDSRDFGTIPYQDIIGKAILIYYPFGRTGKLGQLGEGK